MGDNRIGTDIATAILGGASFALVLFALIIAVLALISSLIFSLIGKPWIEDVIDRKVQIVAENAHRELAIRTKMYVGYIFGTFYKYGLNKEKLLEQAVLYSRAAHDGRPDKFKLRDVARNNWAYYASLRGDIRDVPEVVEIAEMFKARYPITEDIDEITTYASIVASYYSDFETPRDAIADAIRLMRAIIQDPNITKPHKDNARAHIIKLRQSANNLPGGHR